MVTQARVKPGRPIEVSLLEKKTGYGAGRQEIKNLPEIVEPKGMVQ